MLRGDISNQSGITIGFRCVGFFIQYKENTFADKILNTVFSKTKRAEVDPRVAHVMEFIYRKTEYNVDLVIEEKDYKKDLKDFLDDKPYNRIVVVKSPAQITQRLLIGDISWYVDDNDYRRSLINNRHAITLSELGQIIKLKL